MSGSQRKTLLQSLSGQDKQRVLLLVQRLQQQTQARAHYMQLYEQSQQQLNTLQLKHNQLKDQNKYLKQQIHNSFSIVSQVRAQFRANKNNNQGDWQDQPDNEENHPINNTMLKPPKPLSSQKKSKQVDRSNILNMSQSQLGSAGRSQELEGLRREVRMLQEEKRAKEQEQKGIKEKYRLVDQIKNRYKKQQDSIDVSATFQDEEEGGTPVKNIQLREAEGNRGSRSKQNEVSIDKNKESKTNRLNLQSKRDEKISRESSIQQRSERQNSRQERKGKQIRKQSKNVIQSNREQKKSKQVVKDQKKSKTGNRVTNLQQYGDVFEMINYYNL